MVIRSMQISRLKRYILHNEKVIDVTSPARMFYYKYYLIGIIVIGLSIPLNDYIESFTSTAYLYMSILFFALMIVVAELRRNSTFLVLTDKRIILMHGLIHPDFADVIVSKVTDSRLMQDFMGMLFNYGTLTLNTPGSTFSEIVFKGIPNPKHRKYLIDTEIHRVKQQRYGPPRGHGYHRG